MDEREAKESGNELILQYPTEGVDHNFKARVDALYEKTAKFYSKAKTLFATKSSELDTEALRNMILKIQGLNLLDSSTDSMQQVFMTFVPAVFKKELDQYFTPLTLINCMVEVLKPGINDKVIDPAMGTGDFLTAVMQYRFKIGDSGVVSRVYGIDKDPQAYELAVVNMILNKDGQTYLQEKDSIKEYDLWEEEMNVALCNPPFGAKTVETRPEVLREYDLAHVWEQKDGVWTKTEKLQDSQQLGILFIERCFKSLVNGGKLGIILPEGYLCTPTYGYVRQWILHNFKITGLVELPRRIFLKSDADLRSNILFAIKQIGAKENYPIHTELVRRVGYKLGKGFFPLLKRDPTSGLEARGMLNQKIIDTDFDRVRSNFKHFTTKLSTTTTKWGGATLQDIISHPQLDMKPRRLSVRAKQNIESVLSSKYVLLKDIAEVVESTVDISSTHKPSDKVHLIEGQDIRAAEGTVSLRDAEKRWEVEQRKTNKVYAVSKRDIIVGLVRPERRNIGFFNVESANKIYASPDGVAIVRERADLAKTYPVEWIFHALRTEQCRIQFWTESGGTSYGKLTLEHINNVKIPVPCELEIMELASKVKRWSKLVNDATRLFHSVWHEHDKVVILNSPVTGLESQDFTEDDDDDD